MSWSRLFFPCPAKKSDFSSTTQLNSAALYSADPSGFFLAEGSAKSVIESDTFDLFIMDLLVHRKDEDKITEPPLALIAGEPRYQLTVHRFYRKCIFYRILVGSWVAHPFVPLTIPT